MSPRTRVIALVAVVAAAASATVVGVVALSGGKPDAGAIPTAIPREQPGAPPLSLELGFRADREARDLRRATRLYNSGRRVEAGELFARHDSLEAKLGRAFAAWPERTVDRLAQLAALHPRSALVQLHLGLARFWAGEPGAEDAWRAAAAGQPDTPYAVTAGDLLYPRFARGLPVLVPSFGAPASITSLPPAKQLAALAQQARAGGIRARLLYGVGLQRVGRPVSAERVYVAVAREAPTDAEAQVAAAVGRFDKARPEDAFSRLGPLTRRFPGAATVRFHLGLLLLWTGRLEAAKRQLRLALQAQPESPLAAEAGRYLERLRAAGAG